MNTLHPSPPLQYAGQIALTSALKPILILPFRKSTESPLRAIFIPLKPFH